MCRIKFQGESLETFFIYEVVQYPENEDLGVVGPPGPARNVTVKPLFLGLEKTISIPSYRGLVFKTANKDTSNTFITFNSVIFLQSAFSTLGYWLWSYAQSRNMDRIYLYFVI